MILPTKLTTSITTQASLRSSAATAKPGHSACLPATATASNCSPCSANSFLTSPGAWQHEPPHYLGGHVYLQRRPLPLRAVAERCPADHPARRTGYLRRRLHRLDPTTPCAIRRQLAHPRAPGAQLH